MIVELLFWIFLGIIIYTYLLFWFVLYLGVKIRKHKPIIEDPSYEPEVCLFIAAYNEKEYLHAKMQNCLSLDYPKQKLRIVWVTDGSDDGSVDVLKKYQNIEVYHQPQRNGKIGAINRGMLLVSSPIIIFSDCNSILTTDSIREIVRYMSDPRVGCVAGEKRIVGSTQETAAVSGERIYWKYESCLKKYESKLDSAIGAAGELFAIRKDLFSEVEENIILDDFIISMRIASLGYLIAYAPNACATETASLNIQEELKRKIRIASGCMQALVKLKHLLNPFKYGWLSVNYISHKVLRWTLVPIAFPIVFVLNMYLSSVQDHTIYLALFFFQLVLYAFVLLGNLIEEKSTKFKILTVPYYIYLMNYSIYLGAIRYFKDAQSVNWDKSARS